MQACKSAGSSADKTLETFSGRRWSRAEFVDQCNHTFPSLGMMQFSLQYTVNCAHSWCPVQSDPKGLPGSGKN